MALSLVAVLAFLSGVVVTVLGLLRRTSARDREPVVAGVPAVAASVTGTPAPAPAGAAVLTGESVLVDVEREQLVRRWAGLAAGLVAAATMVWASSRWGGDDHGRSLFLVPAVVGLGVVVGVLGGDRQVRPPTSPQRSAGLERRRLLDYLPHRLSVTVALTALVLGALLAMTTLLGSRDPSTVGSAGRVVALRCLAEGGTSVSSRGPWLGSFYSVPLAVAVVVVLAVAAIGARAVVLRPRASADAGDRCAIDADERLRRRSAEALVAGCGAAVAATLLLAAPLTAIAMVGFRSGGVAAGQPVPCLPPGWWASMGWPLVTTAALAAVVLVWCAAVVLVPTRRHDVATGQR